MFKKLTYNRAKYTNQKLASELLGEVSVLCGRFHTVWFVSSLRHHWNPSQLVWMGADYSSWGSVSQLSEPPFKPKGGTYMILRRYISSGLFCRSVPPLLCSCGVPKQTHKSSLLSGGISVPNKADEPRWAPSWKVLFRHDSDTKLLLSWKRLACVKRCCNICHATFFFSPTTLLTFWFPNFLFFSIFRLCSPPVFYLSFLPLIAVLLSPHKLLISPPISPIPSSYRIFSSFSSFSGSIPIRGPRSERDLPSSCSSTGTDFKI